MRYTGTRAGAAWSRRRRAGRPLYCLEDIAECFDRLVEHGQKDVYMVVGVRIHVVWRARSAGAGAAGWSDAGGPPFPADPCLRGAFGVQHARVRSLEPCRCGQYGPSSRGGRWLGRHGATEPLVGQHARGRNWVLESPGISLRIRRTTSLRHALSLGPRRT